jgi:hypothetical protein
MPYVIGIVLSVSVPLFARCVGFDRDRAFYPTVLMVIASSYVLFAAITGSDRAEAEAAGIKTLVLSHLTLADDPEVAEHMWIVATRVHAVAR